MRFQFPERTYVVLLVGAVMIVALSGARVVIEYLRAGGWL